jgi:ceramide glucosyltransferase
MVPVAFVLIALVLVPGLFTACYPLFIARVLARGQGGAGRNPSTCGRVSVIVPCRGLEEGQAAGVAAVLAQSFTAPAEILFCVARADDPAVAVIEPLLAERREGVARLVVTGPAGEALGKMHNLLGGLAAATGDRLVFLDSDVRLPDPGYLERFVAGLAEPGVGLVTCFPACRQAGSVAAAVVTLLINDDLLGLFAFVGARGDLSLANGSCLAVDRAALTATGGLGALDRQLLMDTALAQRVRSAGLRVRLHDEAAPVHTGRLTWAQAWRQSRRWHAAMWRVLPRWQYAGFAWLRGATLLGLLLAVGALGAGHAAAAPLVFATAGTLGLRCAVALWLDRRRLHAGLPARWWCLLPLVELAGGLEAWTAPLTREIHWRGTAYRVDRRGRATPAGRDATEPGLPT